MRILRTALLLAIAPAALASTAVAGTAPTRNVCNAAKIDVYFWPHGHPMVPSLGFPGGVPGLAGSPASPAPSQV